jgi:hypothetical protein
MGAMMGRTRSRRGLRMSVPVSVSVRLRIGAKDGGKVLGAMVELLAFLRNGSGSESRLGMLGSGVRMGERPETEFWRRSCWVRKTEVSGVVAGVSARLGLKWDDVR